MKMLYINCNISVLQELIKILDSSKIKSYQIIENVKSLNRAGDPRFDTAVWPGYDGVVFVPLKNSDNKKIVFDKIREYNSKILNADEKISACSFDIDDYIF
ncbi:MAG: hypothetical protein CR982_01770 [Candidatus Cloacimonadota bacterium]|nr:MAG: hypothetical protein CR982_01770 [Candidatus Cloacimonadota bacterium]PIE77450.1 MAG: hypothetical protein CSA15_12890 [Candidatus Delongbacteria bacterium]